MTRVDRHLFEIPEDADFDLFFTVIDIFGETDGKVSNPNDMRAKLNASNAHSRGDKHGKLLTFGRNSDTNLQGRDEGDAIPQDQHATQVNDSATAAQGESQSASTTDKGKAPLRYIQTPTPDDELDSDETDDEDAEIEAAKKEIFDKWFNTIEARLPASHISATNFPYLPKEIDICDEPDCVARKSRKEAVGACQHDLEMLLRVSGKYSERWLRKQRERWHSDKFVGKTKSSGGAPEMLNRKANEMFSLFTELIEAES